MKKQILFLACILSCAGFAFSQEKNLRESFVLNLAVNEEQYYAAEINESPYVLPENTVQVYPDEELYIEADVEDNVLVNLKNVEKIENPEKTLIIKFSQICDGKKHQAMMLSVFNPFEQDLGYSAIIYLLMYGRWVESEVIDIKPESTGYETWRDIICTIALTDWKLK